MPQFHETMMGKRFIEGTMPKIAAGLEKLALVLEKQGAQGQLERLQDEATNPRHPIPDSQYQAKPHQCPYCQSSSITAQDADFEGNHVFNTVACDDCGQRWSEQYLLLGYQAKVHHQQEKS